jgi:hypothetical protein
MSPDRLERIRYHNRVENMSFDAHQGEKVVLFKGLKTTKEAYNKSIRDRVIEPGYGHYINATHVYSCYPQYKANNCLASASNSSLNYFSKDGKSENYIRLMLYCNLNFSIMKVRL